MNRNKKNVQLVKKLVELSKVDELVEASKVSEVLASLKELKLPHTLGLLKLYLHQIRREIALHTATVYSPTALSTSVLSKVEQDFTKLYGRKIKAVAETDTSLIAGVRVRVGDDLYDSSVAGRLQRLAENVH
jgi:F-type H+-transporting ATPase subunit delta